MGEFKIKLRPNQEYITLQSVLQVGGIIDTGGMAKAFLEMEEVLVNGELENRRGRKLYPGDKVETLGKKFIILNPWFSNPYY